MNIINEYRRVTEDIAVCKSNLKSINRDINKLINAYRPGELKGIDYTQDRVQNNAQQIDIFTNFAKMQQLIIDRDAAEKELEDLLDQRNSLEETINILGDVEKKAIMLRIKGYTNLQIAEKLYYSRQGIEKIFQRSRKKLEKKD